VVCLHNDYSLEVPVFNGSTWEISNIESVGDRKFPILELDLVNDFNETTVRVPLECFTERKFQRYHGLQQFDYGYSLTVHKAQGSEWDSVMLINESRLFRGDARRWLYTGITRACRKLTVVDYS
jgi:exodeoxyribonuclease-5